MIELDADPVADPVGRVGPVEVVEGPVERADLGEDREGPGHR